MTKALTTRDDDPVRGLVAAGASAVLPGLGQLINGDTDKAIGVAVTFVVAGAGFWSALPLVGTAAGLVASLTWVYGVADGYLRGKKKK
ncbi:MAG: hypothetical protein D6689_05785 [Deltaproteobacteria bacterium]|nr:MAG: hypothetical protein D6689_05785 [Deltaproteobacteria bacterium]